MANKIKIDVSILNEFKSYRFSNKSLIKNIFNIILDDDNVKNALKISFEDVNKVSVDFVFCSDDKIRAINAEYRNIDKPTDVITFALFIDSSDVFRIDNEINLGEIIISVETAKRQAKGTFEEEICTLIAHGILHLLGFDHQTEMDYNFVVEVQNNVLEVLRNGKIQIT